MKRLRENDNKDEILKTKKAEWIALIMGFSGTLLSFVTLLMIDYFPAWVVLANILASMYLCRRAIKILDCCGK